MLERYDKWVRAWLILGCVLVFFQVIIGGITRISGSGLSITKWEIVTGTLPPTNETDWNVEFDLYKETPQYKKINDGMSLSDFKFIYFWEYFHRLWARFMGFAFLFPFIFFLFKKRIDKRLMRLLGLVIVAAILAASMGWIMVASGLVDRPWVNAYKLALHLSVAFLTYGLLLWTTFVSFWPKLVKDRSLGNGFKKSITVFFSLLLIQLFFGGVMSGMKAGLVFPTWPDMLGSYVPAEIFNSTNWNTESFNNYDQGSFVPALMHFIHRGLAYLLFFYGIIIFIKGKKENQDRFRVPLNCFLLLLCTQVVLGILTVINCIGTIPLFLGVMHQAFALLLLSIVLYLVYLISAKSN